MRRIACGYVCLDIYPQRDFVSIGGESANFAIGTALAGHEIEFIGKVGADDLGKSLRETLRNQKVTTHLIKTAAETAFCVVVTDGIERHFPVSSKGPYVQHPLKPEDLGTIEAPSAIHLDFTSVHLLEHFNDMPGVLTSADFRRNWLLSFPLYADVTFVSIGAEESPEELANEIRDRARGKLVVMTRGATGSWALAGGKMYHQPAPRIEVVDSTGAGDAYQAGFMLEFLKSGDVPAAMAAGTDWGVRACGRLGASLGEIYLPQALKIERLSFAKAKLGR